MLGLARVCGVSPELGGHTRISDAGGAGSRDQILWAGLPVMTVHGLSR